MPIAELAAEFGTPTYVYDMSVIDQRVADLAEFGTIRYAQKGRARTSLFSIVYASWASWSMPLALGMIGRAMKAGYVPNSNRQASCIPPTCSDKAALDLIVRHNIHCEHRLARYDRSTG